MCDTCQNRRLVSTVIQLAGTHDEVLRVESTIAEMTDLTTTTVAVWQPFSVMLTSGTVVFRATRYIEIARLALARHMR